ncbi:MAG: hypothetical protein KDD46_00180 [Bdellovibrionales bacterium]|nr:hypothetical protein [Bdellovibrionales bacterium]
MTYRGCIHVAVFIICSVFSTSFVSAYDHADKTQNILVKDIGVLGLASHDLFAWDHENEMSKENGRLDLSTIFDADENGYLTNGDQWYAIKQWELGGNKKNSENAPVYTITQALVQTFRNYIEKDKLNPAEARKKTVIDFHKLVKDSYERMLGMTFPINGSYGAVTNQEQAALRVLHDILPGTITLIRDNHTTSFLVTNPDTAKTVLSFEELMQPIQYFNGKYDDEYHEIRTGAPFIARVFGAPEKINLEEIDKKFIKKYGEDFTLDSGLLELCEMGERGCTVSQLSFSRHYDSLFSKGICRYQQSSELINPWIPSSIKCKKM